MPYVVTEACIKCKYTDCVAVCPVDCFYEGENCLVIHPDECIDCGACEPECPTKAIFDDSSLPEKYKPFIEINAVLSGAKASTDADSTGWPTELAKAVVESGFNVWPNITAQKEALPEADKVAEIEDKLADLSPNGATE